MRTRLISAALLLATAPTLFGHAGPHEQGLSAGLLHPIHGLDHLLAMIAVGLLGVRCASTGNRHALWQVPAAFMGAMVIGGWFALAGLPMPGAEWGIALSVLVFGVLIALASAPRTWVAAVVAGSFALLHGHAHVSEMEGSIATYMGGFLATTALLHAIGILAGVYIARTWAQTPVRLAGAGVALASLTLFIGLV